MFVRPLINFPCDRYGQYHSFFTDEKVEWTTYNTWGVVLPDGAFDATIGPEPFQEILARFGGPKAKEEWAMLMEYMAPLSVAAMALPPATLRNDLGAIFTVGRYASAVMKTIPVGPKLQSPFSSILEELNITDPFIKNWLSLLCFLLQGVMSIVCFQSYDALHAHARSQHDDPYHTYPPTYLHILPKIDATRRHNDCCHGVYACK